MHIKRKFLQENYIMSPYKNKTAQGDFSCLYAVLKYGVTKLSWGLAKMGAFRGG